jgi:hypothetical protein
VAPSTIFIGLRNGGGLALGVGQPHIGPVDPPILLPRRSTALVISKWWLGVTWDDLKPVTLSSVWQWALESMGEIMVSIVSNRHWSTCNNDQKWFYLYLSRLKRPGALDQVGDPGRGWAAPYWTPGLPSWLICTSYLPIVTNGSKVVEIVIVCWRCLTHIFNRQLSYNNY